MPNKHDDGNDHARRPAKAARLVMRHLTEALSSGDDEPPVDRSSEVASHHTKKTKMAFQSCGDLSVG